MKPISRVPRCTRCLLPVTMPFISFDDEGVCNYCHSHEEQLLLGREAMESWAETHKRTDEGPDTLVSFSGGRDSSYGLHVFCKELGMNPIAFTYDWGMVTDIAKRSQTRMCEQLGVKHIVVEANIRRKRDSIRRNILAWLKRPDLGLVPLFMAGDKQYFYHANKIMKENRLSTAMMADNPYEKTYFKSAFCGSSPEGLQKNQSYSVEKLRTGSILQMAFYYARQFLVNPSYLNRSIIDTMGGAISYYFIPHNYFRLFQYIPWDEELIDTTLSNEYGWERDPENNSTWRIGDGTAAFYNYIYLCVAGITENDTLRSNQIMAGLLIREEAQRLAERDNKINFKNLQWYFDVLDLDMEVVLKRVQKIPKLYAQF